MFIKGIFSQYYAIGCANLATLTYAISMGWPSASLPILKSPDGPLPSGPLSFAEASWTSSSICIGGALGTMLYGWLVDFIGRKWSILSTSILIITSWLLIEFGFNFYCLLAARLIAGCAGGGLFVVIPMFVSETADSKIRGTLGSLLILFHNTGIILSYIITSYLDYYIVPWIPITFCIIFLICFGMVPETPKYLFTHHNNEMALKSLKYYKGDINATEDCLTAYLADVGGGDGSQLKLSDFCEPATKRGILIGIVLMISACFTGVLVLVSYYETIFRMAGGTLSPEMSSIIVACIQLTGSYVATMTVEKAGRKILILISCYGAALSLAILGAYSLVTEMGVDTNPVNWLPIVCLSCLAFVAAMGIACLAFVLLGEIFAQKVRGPLISFCMVLNWMENFVMILLFPYMLEYLRLYGALWVFTVVGTILATVLVFILPETKGLSIEKIIDILAGNY